MGNLLFSPSGRINPSEFMRWALVLIVLSFAISILSLLGIKTLDAILNLVSFALMYPWIIIWIKRYHDAGKSGWMCLIPILIFTISWSVVLMMMLGNEFGQMMELATSGASPAEQEEVAQELLKGKQLPAAIASTVLSAAIAYLFNSMIKRDDHENQFGPAS